MKLPTNKLIGLLLGLSLLFPAQAHAEAVEVQVSGFGMNPWARSKWVLLPGLGGGYDFRAPASRAQGWSWVPSLIIILPINEGMHGRLPVMARYRCTFHQQFSVDCDLGGALIISKRYVGIIVPLLGLNLNYTFENKIMTGISLLTNPIALLTNPTEQLPLFNVYFSLPVGVSEEPASPVSLQ